MNILAFDASSPHFILGVSRNGRRHCLRPVRLHKTLSATIIPRIGKALAAAKIDLKQINGIAVGLGPGSFTSLRVAMATAKGLAAATDKPIVGIPSLDILAENVRLIRSFREGTVCCVNDARRGLVYGAVYAYSGGVIARKTPYLLTSLGDVLKYVKGPAAFFGDAVAAYRDDIRAAAGAFNPAVLDEKKIFPRPDSLLALAETRFRGQDSDDLDTLVPLYLYPEDCQVRR